MTPSAFGTSPKYDIKTAYDDFNFGGRIWGRKSADPRAGMSKAKSAVDELVASRELYGLTVDEVRIVEGKG